MRFPVIAKKFPVFSLFNREIAAPATETSSPETPAPAKLSHLFHWIIIVFLGSGKVPSCPEIGAHAKGRFGLPQSSQLSSILVSHRKLSAGFVDWAQAFRSAFSELRVRIVPLMASGFQLLSIFASSSSRLDW